MSAIATETESATEALKTALYTHLFSQDESIKTFAVLDGASIPDLLDHLYADPGPEFVCLYRGELRPDMAEVAPYLVRLERDKPFTDWVLAEGWGEHWGVFAVAQVNLTAVRKHFRSFLMVKSPEGKQFYFRYYDPQVFRLYLPTCNGEEVKFVFGPVDHFIIEGDQPGTLLRAHAGKGGAKIDLVKLGNGR